MLFLLLACEPPPPTLPAQTANEPSVQAVEPATQATSDPARDAADQAFNDAMRADQAKAPDASELVARARAAYGALSLDSDGLLHLALLELAAGDPAAACTTAQRILVDHPDHLLAIGTCARASERLADTVATRMWHERFVAAWDRPREELPELEHHARMLPALQKEAVTALAAP